MELRTGEELARENEQTKNALNLERNGRWLTTILPAAILFLGTLLLYSRVIHDQFLSFDDRQYVVRNAHVNTGLQRDNVIWAFTTFEQANWHPVTWLSHMVDCQVFGLNSGAQHLINVVLHGANVLLLFLLLRAATGAVWRSFLVAALFAAHPLNVETVAWLAERKSLLSMFFSLLTIAAYGWYVQRPRWRRFLLVIAGFALALMSKPMAVSLPLVLLLLDYWPMNRSEEIPPRRRWEQLVFEKTPLFVMSAADCVMTIIAQRSGGAIANVSALPLSLRFGNAIVSYVRYIGKTVWPADLAVFYPHPQKSLSSSDVIAAAFVLLVITAAALFMRRAKYCLVGWLLFVITLIPVIGIVQVGRQAMADHYAYIPCIGLFILIVWGSVELAAAIRLPRAVPVGAGLLSVAACAFATNHYLAYWQDGVKLFSHARLVAGQPDPAIEEALADALVAAGRYDEAYQHYAAACTLRPQDAICHYNLAEILFNRHQLRDALEQYRIAAGLPGGEDVRVPCLVNSSEILFDLGNYQAAQKLLEAVLKIDPTDASALRLRERFLQNAKGTYGAVPSATNSQ